MMKRILFLTLFCIDIGFTIQAQSFDVLNKTMYEARVKLLDEFYARFNGKEQRKDVGEKYADRKSNILMLLDFSRFKSKEDSCFIAAEAFTNKVVNNSILLNYADPYWFAKVKCHGLLAKKEVDFLLYLSVEKRGKDMYKWVISDAEGSIFSTSRNIDHKELFLRPNDHEQSFMSLARTTEETSQYIDDFVKDGYESDALSVFLTLVRCGQLQIDYTSEVEFVYLQVPEYIFSVKHFERETLNAGWLICSIEKCDDTKKVELLSRLHCTSACETIIADTTVIEENEDLVTQPEVPTIQKDTVILRTTVAEKTVRRFWDNIKLFCETKDFRYRKNVIKECAGKKGRECRIKNNGLMKEFVSLLHLEQNNAYMLDSYLNGFRLLLRKGTVEITIGDIKEIENSEEFCIVSCCINITGAINAEYKDLFYIRRLDGKVSSITSIGHPKNDVNN